MMDFLILTPFTDYNDRRAAVVLKRLELSFSSVSWN